MEPALDRRRAALAPDPEDAPAQSQSLSMWTAAGAAVRSGASFLAELLDRIASGIKGMVPLVCAIGCQGAAGSGSGAGADQQATRPPPVVEEAKVSVAEEPVFPEAGPRQIGHFNITFYYVVGEEEILARIAKRKAKAAANDNQLAALAAVLAAGAGSRAEAGAGSGAGSGVGSGTGSRGKGGAGSGVGGVATALAGGEGGAGSGGDATALAGSNATELAAATPPETVTLYSSAPGCEPIAETSREFAFELNMQGTGKLRDGRVLNVWGPCNCPKSPCWKVIEQQWGTGGSGRALQPFRTVAVDPKLIKLGSLLHIPLLEGRTMPGRPPWGGFVHDGCVVADDTGGAIRNYQLDLFVGRKAWFLGMSGHPGRNSWARHIPVFDGSKICERKGRKISRKAGSI